MTIRPFCLTLVLVAALAAPLAGSDDVFQISLPAGYGEFAKKVQNVPSPDGEIETTNWISRSPAGGAVIVTMSRMPGRILDPQKLMTSTRESLLKTLNATLESTEDRQSTLPSERLYFTNGSAFFRSRFVVDNDRFYQLLYMTRSADERTSPAVVQLFDSFSITPQQVTAAQ
jgi:hypothetical protein